MVTLETSKLFSQLSATDLQPLRAVTRELSFPAGRTIFKEGDPGDGIYVLKTGLVQISAVLENGERHVLSGVLPGDIFGEMAALDNQPRSACASAEKDVSAYFVPRDALVGLLKRSPELSMLLVQEISGRLREFNRQYIRKLLQTERMTLVGRFASSIVHDLKNPLTLIGLSADQVCTGDPSPELRKTTQERIAKQVDRITNLVNDILDFTRGSTPEMILAQLEYSDFIKPLVEELRAETAATPVGIEFETPPPPVKIPINPRRLSRVFQNLVGNAVDAMPEGGTIKLRFEVKDREVVTEVQDSGPGIAPEVIDHLFEAFVSFGKPRGTGLGLSITKKIIEEHGGKISARNQQGGGAVFSFTLPRSSP